jgi:hypothetical protein
VSLFSTPVKLRVGATSLCLTGFVACLAASLVSACADSTTEFNVPTPNVKSFEQNAYPVLLRDCGFPECHGNPQRFFHVYGPGRTRGKPKEQLPVSAPATAEELTETYHRARSMLAYEGSAIESSLLLNKPLDAAHEGTDEWGNNVYASAQDPSYQVLLAWARSTQSGAPDAGVSLPDAGVSLPDAGVSLPDAGVP